MDGRQISESTGVLWQPRCPHPLIYLAYFEHTITTTATATANRFCSYSKT